MSNPEIAAVDLDAGWLDDLHIFNWSVPAAWEACIDDAEKVLRGKHGLAGGEDAALGEAAAKKPKSTAASSSGPSKESMLRSNALACF